MFPVLVQNVIANERYAASITKLNVYDSVAAPNQRRFVRTQTLEAGTNLRTSSGIAAHDVGTGRAPSLPYSVSQCTSRRNVHHSTNAKAPEFVAIQLEHDFTGNDTSTNVLDERSFRAAIPASKRGDRWAACSRRPTEASGAEAGCVEVERLG